MEKDSTSHQIRPRRAFGIKKFCRLCLKYWLWFVISLMVIGCGTVFYLLHRQDTKEVDAQVMLPQDTSSTSLMAEMSRSFSFGDFMGSSTSTDNEMDVMRSHTVFLNTAKELELNTTLYVRDNPIRWVPTHINPPLELKSDPAIGDTITRQLVFDVRRNDAGRWKVKIKILKKVIWEAADQTLPLVMKTPYGEFTLVGTDYLARCKSKRFRFTFGSYHGAAEGYAQVVKVFIPNKKTDFIGLTYSTNEPKFGKQLLSTIIAQYNELGVKQQNERDSKSLSFINQRIESLTEELAESERKIEAFKMTHKITDPEADVQVLLQKSTSIEGEMLGAQTEHEILSMTRQFISNPANNYSLIPSLGVDGSSSSQPYAAASDAISKYNEVMLERMKIASSAKGNNAALKMLDDQLEAMRKNIIVSVDRAYNNSSVKLGEIRKENNNTASRIGTIPTLEREYEGLKRVQLVQEQLYLFLLKQREETSMNIARVTPTLLTIDEPHTIVLDNALSNAKILCIALFIALLIPALMVYFFKYSETTMTGNEFGKQCDAPVIANIPPLGPDNRKILFQNRIDGETDPAVKHAVESYRALRHNVQDVLYMLLSGAVMVTSPKGGEGKGVVAANLAASLGLLGKRTLLVDTDMRHPEIAALLGMADTDGLQQLLTGKDSVPNVRTVELLAGRTLDVLTAGGVSEISSELLASQAYEKFVDEVHHQYDYVVACCPEVADNNDTFEIAKYAQLTLMVVGAGVTTGPDIDFVNRLYEGGRLPRIALVVTDSDAKTYAVNDAQIAREAN